MSTQVRAPALASQPSASHDRFLSMLPVIREQASIAFRSVRPDLREELTAEVVANTYCAHKRLADRGKLDAAYASPLAKYAIRQVRSGRRVGTKDEPVGRHLPACQAGQRDRS